MPNLIQRAALALAKLSGYNAAMPQRSQKQADRVGINPNSGWIAMQRRQLSLEGLRAVRNTPFGVNYVNKRIAYCSAQITWQPDTGDAELDELIADKTGQAWATMGIECSMQEAFSRVADVHLPVLGDAALRWFRDEDGRLRLVEVPGNLIGEPVTLGDREIDGLKYTQGLYWKGCNVVKYRIYDEPDHHGIAKSNVYNAQDIIFFKDDIAGGVRGISKFAVALEDVNSRYQILKAVKDTMQKQAKTAVFSTNNSGAPSEYDYQTQTANGTIDYVESYGDGAITEYRFNGDSFQFLKSENPSDAFLNGLKYVDAQACLAVGLPYEFLITAEASGGAPSRLAINAASREITRIRERVHRPRLNKISYVTIMDLVERGELPDHENIARGAWHFGTLPTADAFRDDAANIDAIRAGITTRAAVIAANSGQTFPALVRQTGNETFAIHKEAQDVNRRLAQAVSPVDGKPYLPSATVADIALNTDNPAGLGTPTAEPQKPSAPE
jgi:hypothetical protein